MNGKAFESCLILANETIAEGIFRLSVVWTGPEPRPGQFFMIKPARSSVFLGRPISVFSWSPGSEPGPGAENGDNPDPDTSTGSGSGIGVLGFIIALRGTGSIELSGMQSDEEVELIGPLGNLWPAVDPYAKKPVALVGGGVGIAPLAFLARQLPPASFDLYAGFRSGSYGIEGLGARTLILATEDGCEGCRGRIPDFLEPHHYSAIYACGPDPMIRAVVQACERTGTPCFVSMERHMACGVGACLGCTVRTKNGNRRCCADGPVFDAKELLLDE